MTVDSRIDDLEWRLDRYHTWLTDAIAERDRLALDAAWGVHFALYYNLAAVLFVVFLAKYADSNPWYASVGVGVLFFVAQFVIGSWSSTARMKDVDRLAKLPEWELKLS
jgi:hypothetical protein